MDAHGDAVSQPNNTLEVPAQSGRPPVVAKPYFFVAIGLLAAAVLWLIYIRDPSRVYMAHAPEWFGRPVTELPTWFGFAAIVLGLLPAFVFIGASWLCLNRFERANQMRMHQATLEGIQRAKVALSQGLKSIDELERQYREKIQRFEQVQQQLEELQTVRHIDTQQLQRKLNAIAYASRYKVWTTRIGAFLLGIVSSILSSYLWDLISK